MTYGWIITADHMPEGEPGTNQNAVGVNGPRTITEEHADTLRGLLASGVRVRPESVHTFRLANISAFRLFDDDGELYYEGLFIGDHEGSEAFGPLDDFGGPNAGCTRIDYLYPNGEWRPL